MSASFKGSNSSKFQDSSLKQPMYLFLGILSVVDMGLSTTIMPKILTIFWFDAKAISLPECFAQIYAIHSFLGMESGVFLCMAFDRYVAISSSLLPIDCHQFLYHQSYPKWLVIPVPVLSAQHHFCFRNEIEHCLCSHLGVKSLACDDRRPNSICQGLVWLGMESDLSLIVLSYSLILRSVHRLNSAEAVSKALSTCSCHLILIFFFYKAVVVVLVTYLAETKNALIPVLLNVLHNIIPPSLNPMVYALRELREGFQKVFCLHLRKK
ncbi:OR56B1 [Ictidomys tridecemlineatus]|uniref:G-protein coupled receptors family 1 profile domain-containing protein n=1 Tax=Ictidomys tridecemlineatus TaxID=43179 RepID=A0A287DB69_ICTTR|nr:OR56B1 [Ictidomys tridecemlineatus]